MAKEQDLTSHILYFAERFMPFSTSTAFLVVLGTHLRAGGGIPSAPTHHNITHIYDDPQLCSNSFPAVLLRCPVMSSPYTEDAKWDLESNHTDVTTVHKTLPTLATTPTGIELSRRDHKSMERTNSISLIGGPVIVSPSAKLPGDFRTLSIHVTDTQDGRADKSKSKDIADLATLEWHKLSTNDVCNRLGVSYKTGLDPSMAARRLSKNGKNVISRPPRNLPKKIFFYFFGGFGSLLFGGSILCFVSWKPLGEPNPSIANLALAIVLLIVMLLQAFFNAWQDFSTSRIMASISGMLPTDILVTRDGSTFKIPAAQLVSGDIVTITLGSKVPADLRLIEVSSDLRFDRSILTGESNAIAATTDCTDANFMESRNIALQGTLCTSGSGVGVCVALGDGTIFGRIAKQAGRERPVLTTLELEIRRFVLIIAALAFVVALIIVILWAAWLRRSFPSFISVSVLIVDCVSVAVAFIPEGLPIAVTLSLTVIANAMRKSSILCKSLSTVEGLGAVNFLASDKTGTLTENKMTAVGLAIGQQQYTVAEAQEKSVKGQEGHGVQVLAGIASLCNDATFEDADDSQPIEVRKINGDATDIGLLRFAEGIVRSGDIRQEWNEVGKVAFNSKNKFAIKLFRTRKAISSTSIPTSPSDNFYELDYLLLVKGAPDVLSRRCSKYMDMDGNLNSLDAHALETLTALQTDFASKGQRVLLLAKKVISSSVMDKEVLLDASQLEGHLVSLNTDLVAVGLVAMVDPPRHDTEETVRICRRAGIRFAMVTGDFAVTATAIARQVGIITTDVKDVKHIADLPYDTPLDQIPAFDDNKKPGDVMTSLVLSGSEMITMTDSQWKQVQAFDEIVFARTSPQQKLQIVRTFQASGCTVAVTGDGVNDAPALKQADVGVAVAGGSEVAIEAADLILLNNFSAIITGIQYGRLCFQNLRKTVLYLLPAGSFSELTPVLVNVLFGVPQALSSIQMVIICAITDIFPALSLIYEKPEADLLLRKPRNRKTDRLGEIKLFIQAYGFIGMFESLTSMVGAFYFGFQRNGIPFSAMWLKYGNYDVDVDFLNEMTNRAQAIYFFNLVIVQWFNLLSTRTRTLSLFQHNPVGGPKTRNIYLFPAMLLALALGCFFSYIGFFQRVFLTRGVRPEFFFLPMGYGVVLLFLDESRKWWIRGHPTSFLARIAW